MAGRMLLEMLHDRLVASGWRDELKEYCKEVIRRKVYTIDAITFLFFLPLTLHYAFYQGLEKVTVEELVAEITPKGRCEYVYVAIYILASFFLLYSVHEHI